MSEPRTDLAAVFDACAELALKRLAGVLKAETSTGAEVIAASRELRELERRHQRQQIERRRRGLS